MAEVKAAIVESGKKNANAEGDPDVTTQELNRYITTFEGLRRACLNKAQYYEAAVKSL